VLAAHPRTRGALDRLAVAARGALHVIPALGYLETVAAIRTAAVVVTDSGGVQREAYWLGVPCVTRRTATEWTETVACGANRLVAPLDAASALAAAVAAQASAARPLGA
jgi:UDP-GlcNAc3NAcA epimerase